MASTAEIFEEARDRNILGGATKAQTPPQASTARKNGSTPSQAAPARPEATSKAVEPLKSIPTGRPLPPDPSQNDEWARDLYREAEAAVKYRIEGMRDLAPFGDEDSAWRDHFTAKYDAEWYDHFLPVIRYGQELVNNDRIEKAEAERAKDEANQTPDIYAKVLAELPPPPDNNHPLYPAWKGLGHEKLRTILKETQSAVADTSPANLFAVLGARSLRDINHDAPPPLLIGKLTERGHTILYGEGGVGKGTLASNWITELIKDGHHILILDYENHPEEWASRIFGFGGDAPSDHITYVSPASQAWTQPHGAIWQQAENIRLLADAVQATYIVIDSIVVACGGTDVGSGSTEAPAKYHDALTQIGRPALSLGHVTRDTNLKYPFGSVYWHNLARFTWSLSWAPGHETTILHNRKHSEYDPQPALSIEVTFTGGLPRSIKETRVSIVIADLIDATLTEPMTVDQITSAINADIEDKDDHYQKDSITRALTRGLQNSTHHPKRFDHTGNLWGRHGAEE
jgi:hypothetical protein